MPRPVFGSIAETKAEIAAEIAALPRFFQLLRNNDKVGLICFTDTVEHFVPPRKGKKARLTRRSGYSPFSTQTIRNKH